MSTPVVIVGAGGHAVVVADALLAAGAPVLGFIDADVTLHGQERCGLPVLGGDSWLETQPPQKLQLANGLGGTGNTRVRETVQTRLAGKGWHFSAVRHPSAIVSPFARIADDAQLLAGCIVQAGASVGQGSIVNTGAVVEHDVKLGAWVHVAPGAVVCGNAFIGARSHVGAGAVVRQGIHLGAETVVGAGAAVVSDHPGAGVLVGVPARAMEFKP